MRLFATGDYCSGRERARTAFPGAPRFNGLRLEATRHVPIRSGVSGRFGPDSGLPGRPALSTAPQLLGTVEKARKSRASWTAVSGHGDTSNFGATPRWPRGPVAAGADRARRAVDGPRDRAVVRGGAVVRRRCCGPGAKSRRQCPARGSAARSDLPGRDGGRAVKVEALPHCKLPTDSRSTMLGRRW